MRCQRMILGIRWHDFVRNTKVVDRSHRTNLPSVRDVIAKRRNSLFVHVVRLDDHTPAHRALSQVAAARTGQCQCRCHGWRRQPGRPRHSWIQQIGDGTPFSICAEWSKARRRDHSGLTQRTVRDLMMMMMTMLISSNNDKICRSQTVKCPWHEIPVDRRYLDIVWEATYRVGHRGHTLFNTFVKRTALLTDEQIT